MRMTPKRQAWFEHLKERGPAKSGTVVGYQCRKAGWTEWFITLADGREMPLSSFYAENPNTPHHLLWDGIVGRTERECITAQGLAALAEAEAVT